MDKVFGIGFIIAGAFLGGFLTAALLSANKEGDPEEQHRTSPSLCEASLQRGGLDIENLENKERVCCGDCAYLMFSDMQGECSLAIKGVVSPEDSCERGVRKK